MCYIELNRVRCGVVAHPRDWEWVGYHEIMGHRRRYRLIDLERLCWRLRARRVEELRENLTASLAERIARDQVKREPWWTESIAAGSHGFVEKIQTLIQSRREMDIEGAVDNVWALREEGSPYG